MTRERSTYERVGLAVGGVGILIGAAACGGGNSSGESPTSVGKPASTKPEDGCDYARGSIVPGNPDPKRAPALWVRAGKVDAGVNGKLHRIDRPAVLRMGGEDKYFKANLEKKGKRFTGRFALQAINMKVPGAEYFARPAWANGGWRQQPDHDPSSVLCTPWGERPPGTQTITYQSGVIRFPGGEGATFNTGITDVGSVAEVHEFGGVGVDEGVVDPNTPAPKNMIGTSQP